jgi:putative ABC transport system permease protein
VFRGRQERELEEELRFHLEREEEARARAGSADPRREALVAFGGVERIKDDVRQARGVQPLEELAADLRFALRALRHNPGFTAAVALVLGLGIGASVAVFRVVDTVLLSDLPYPHAERLVRIVEQNSPTNLWALSTVDYQAIRDQQRSFDAFGVVQRGEAALAGAGSPQLVHVGRATAGYFAALGVTPELGRLVEARDEPVGAPAVVVVSHAFAERSLGGAAAALGCAVTIDGVSHTVIGVLPAGVNALAGVPAAAWPALQPPPPTRRGPFWLRGIARLRAGLTVEDAQRDLAGISRRLLPLYSDWHDSTALLTPGLLREAMVRRAEGPVTLFAVAVALVLLVAIANVATLLLVRATARQHELAVRAALGASRRRLAGLVVTECGVLTALAGIVGLGVAALGLRGVPLVAPNLPRLAEVTLDARALVLLAIATAISGVLVSLSPVTAVLAARGTASARPEDWRAGAGRHTNLVRGALVMAEFALALPLLVSAGLLLNSFVRLQRVDPGFDPAGMLGVSVALPNARYPDFAAVQGFFQQVEQRAAQLPGVVAVGLTSTLPPDNGGGTNNFNLVDHPVAPGEAEPVSPWLAATASYFGALDVPLVDGRLFAAGDSTSAPPVVVVSRAWAEHFFPRESPVGRQLISGGCYDCPRTTIVGVVGDVKYAGIAGSGEAVYSPLTQSNTRSMSVVVHAAAPPATALPALRRVVGGLDPDLPVVETTLQAELNGSLADPRRWTAVLGAFAAAALLLAALGIFGLMSYVVRQRRREIGVRLALGAEPSSLTLLIVRRGMRFAVLGVVLGVGIVLLEARWLGALLYQVPATDPATIAGVASLLMLTALVACWVPGLRAARIRPVEVLASE